MKKFAVGILYEHIQPYERIVKTDDGCVNFINKEGITVLRLQIQSDEIFSAGQYVDVQIIEANTELEAIKKVMENFPFHILQAKAISIKVELTEKWNL